MNYLVLYLFNTSFPNKRLPGVMAQEGPLPLAGQDTKTLLPVMTSSILVIHETSPIHTCLTCPPNPHSCGATCEECALQSPTLSPLLHKNCLLESKDSPPPPEFADHFWIISTHQCCTIQKSLASLQPCSNSAELPLSRAEQKGCFPF